MSRLGRVPLTSTGSGWRPLADRVDDRSASWPIDNLVGWQIQLQQAHRAFDVNADGTRINVSWRRHHAAHGCSVTAVSIGIQHQIRHAGSHAGIDRLLQAHLIEGVADGFRPDHRDRFCLGIRCRQNGRGFARGNDSVCHFEVAMSSSSLSFRRTLRTYGC